MANSTGESTTFALEKFHLGKISNTAGKPTSQTSAAYEIALTINQIIDNFFIPKLIRV